jgi:hypothetical protein
MRYLPNSLKKLSSVKIRTFLGGKYRNHQRSKGLLLTESAEAMATAFRVSLRTNGYGQIAPRLDDYEILILCTSKDFYILEHNLDHLIRNIPQQCTKINVLLNGEKKVLEGIAEARQWKNVNVIEELDFLKEIEKLQGDIGLYNPSRRTWILQQCLKTIFVGFSELPILIIDSDTFVKNGFEVIGNGVQQLYVGNDFHYPYSRHIKKFLMINPIGLSFVHHVQLQKPEIIREIYGSDIVTGLSLWLRTGVALAEYSPVSEFQTYGDYILHKYPEMVRLNFHTHHLLDAREFKSQLGENPQRALESHLVNCDCDFITLANKHLVE